jgi:hypothetical protein
MRLFLLLPVSYFLWLPLAQAGAQVGDQCIACHTDPAKLQALVKPPAEIAEEEGEG